MSYCNYSKNIHKAHLLTLNINHAEYYALLRDYQPQNIQS